MGAAGGKGAADQMAVVIVSHVIQSTRAELLLLRRRILMKKDKKTHFIDRAEFHDALRFVTIDQSDFEIFERLFTLFDKTGSGSVLWRDFIVGLATIVNAAFDERLTIAMELHDEQGTGLMGPNDLKQLLGAMSKTCDFFGDMKMPYDQIDELVESLFATNHEALVQDQLKYKDHVQEIAIHPILEGFLEEGSNR